MFGALWAPTIPLLIKKGDGAAAAPSSPPQFVGRLRPPHHSQKLAFGFRNVCLRHPNGSPNETQMSPKYNGSLVVNVRTPNKMGPPSGDCRGPKFIGLSLDQTEPRAWSRLSPIAGPGWAHLPICLGPIWIPFGSIWSPFVHIWDPFVRPARPICCFFLNA